MAVSRKGLWNTEFTNLIGWDRYWTRSRFAHLNRHLDRLHFAVKICKLNTKLLTIFLQNISSRKYPYYGSAKSDEEKKVKRTSLAELSSAHRRSQAKCQLVQTSYIKRINFILFAINILLSELSPSICENLDLGRVYRPRSRFSHTDLLLG